MLWCGLGRLLVDSQIAPSPSLLQFCYKMRPPFCVRFALRVCLGDDSYLLFHAI
jgi:hypothetical protein